MERKTHFTFTVPTLQGYRVFIANAILAVWPILAIASHWFASNSVTPDQAGEIANSIVFLYALFALGVNAAMRLVTTTPAGPILKRQARKASDETQAALEMAEYLAKLREDDNATLRAAQHNREMNAALAARPDPYAAAASQAGGTALFARMTGNTVTNFPARELAADHDGDDTPPASASRPPAPVPSVEPAAVAGSVGEALVNDRAVNGRMSQNDLLAYRAGETLFHRIPRLSLRKPAPAIAHVTPVAIERAAHSAAGRVLRAVRHVAAALFLCVVLPAAVMTLGGCAVVQEVNAIGQAETAQQRSYALYGAFEVIEARAAVIVRDRSIPAATRKRIQQMDALAKPIADDMKNLTLQLAALQKVPAAQRDLAKINVVTAALNAIMNTLAAHNDTMTTALAGAKGQGA